MTTDHTAIDLLGAVGVDWEQTPELCGTLIHGGLAYTGPALGTPELDALLLVAGLEFVRSMSNGIFDSECAQKIFWQLHPKSKLSWSGMALWLLTVCDTPGHALARAIRKVQG